jgi:hypothetical protein
MSPKLPVSPKADLARSSMSKFPGFTALNDGGNGKGNRRIQILQPLSSTPPTKIPANGHDPELVSSTSDPMTQLHSLFATVNILNKPCTR